jgi:hypothetical protein
MTGPVLPKPKVLTTDSTVTCGHTPSGAVALKSSAKLRVSGFPVLVSAGVGPAIGTGCVVTKQGDVACTTVTAVATEKSTKLRAGGVPVVLDTLTGTTNGAINAVVGLLTVTKVQSKLVSP